MHNFNCVLNVFDICEKNLNKYDLSPIISQSLFNIFCYSNNIVDLKTLNCLTRYDFLIAIYLLLLKRFPEQQAIEKWMSFNGSVNHYRYSLVREVLSSSEFLIKGVIITNNIYNSDTNCSHLSVSYDYDYLNSLDIDDFINFLYIYFLRRKPDISGFNYFKKAFLRKQMTKDDIILNVRYSQEGMKSGRFLNNIGAAVFHATSHFPKEDSEFLDWAYRWILGRNPDSEGKGFYMNLLESKKITCYHIMLSMSRSDEALKRRVKILGLLPLCGCRFLVFYTLSKILPKKVVSIFLNLFKCNFVIDKG